MALDTAPLKQALGIAAMEAANAAKGAVDLAVGRAGSDDYQQAAAIVAMAHECAGTARDLTEALAALEARFPSA